MKAACIGVVVGLFAVVKADERPFERGDFATARRLIEVVVEPAGALGTLKTKWTLADRVLAVERFELREARNGRFHFELSKQIKLELSQKEAANAWSNIAFLSIPTWKSQYRPSDLGLEIDDGIAWSVYLRDGTKECTTGGSNVFPSLTSLGQPTTDSAKVSNPSAFHWLIEVLEALEKNSPDPERAASSSRKQG